MIDRVAGDDVDVKTTLLLSDPVNPVSRLRVRFEGIIQTVENHDTAVGERETVTGGFRVRDQVPDLIVLEAIDRVVFILCFRVKSGDLIRTIFF